LKEGDSVIPRGQMTSRERVHAAIKGLPVDRVPVMYWFNPHTVCRLMTEIQPGRNVYWNYLAHFLWKKYYKSGEFNSPNLWRALPYLLNDYGNGTYVLELGADISFQIVGTGYAVKRIYLEKGQLKVLDAFGSVRGLGSGIYWDIEKPAIKTVEDLADYRFPDFTDDRCFSALRKVRAAYPGVSIMMEGFGVQDLFSTQIWSMAPFMMALYDNPVEVKKFMQRFGDWSIDLARCCVKNGADMIFIYDDYGYTEHTLISMPMWKEFTYPHLKRIIAAVHDAGAIAILHSCGFQTPFLDYYVEAELDALQAFQPKAGNDFQSAYNKYGNRLAFITGIDTQCGEQMSPQEMRESILQSYRIGKIHGRHILGVSHMLQPSMPEQNIKEIFKTVKEIQMGLYD